MRRREKTIRRTADRRRMPAGLLGLVLCGLALLPGRAAAQAEGDVHVYLTVEEALKEVFPASERYITETVAWDAEAQERARKALHRTDLPQAHEVVLAYDGDGRFQGYAVITEELGKHRPITFIVGVTPGLAVQQTAIMVYRESRGGEVRMPRFLYQYRGKTVRDPIRINRDVINVSGATISVRAVNAGVRRVLYLLEDRYRGDPPAPTYAAERATIPGGQR